MTRRWLFADQLGPHFLDEPGQPVLLVESKAVFRRRVFHRQKAHLALSALRHRAAELHDQADFVRTETYADAVRAYPQGLDVCHPTSRAARGLVQRLGVPMLGPRGFVTSPEAFTAWAGGRRGLRMEDFYRDARQRHGILMDGAEPAGGKWNLDADNREAPPRGAGKLDVEPPPPIVEDEIDHAVREDLDRWQRDDGIAFAKRAKENGAKVLFFAEITGGAPTVSEETTAVDFFEVDRLPSLSLARTLPADIELARRYQLDPSLPPSFD